MMKIVIVIAILLGLQNVNAQKIIFIATELRYSGTEIYVSQLSDFLLPEELGRLAGGLASREPLSRGSRFIFNTR